jgi:hypothetical protein
MRAYFKTLPRWLLASLASAAGAHFLEQGRGGARRRGSRRSGSTDFTLRQRNPPGLQPIKKTYW